MATKNYFSPGRVPSGWGWWGVAAGGFLGRGGSHGLLFVAYFDQTRHCLIPLTFCAVMFMGHAGGKITSLDLGFFRAAPSGHGLRGTGPNSNHH